MKELEEVFPFVKRLDQKEKELIMENTRARNYKKGDIVHEGETDCTGVVGIIQGRVKTFMLSSKGKEVALFRLLPKDACILSASCMMNNIVFDVHVSAEEDSEILVVNAEYFEDLTKRNPEAEKFRNDIIAMRFSEVMWLVEQVMFKRMDQRIAGFLLEMINIGGTPEILLSHQEIADNLGTAREVVSRILKYFEKDGIIKISRKAILILDIDRIYEIAQD
jgi:CRP/FNR family transcriptional regulator